jgi:hypothetical protein
MPNMEQKRFNSKAGVLDVGCDRKPQFNTKRKKSRGNGNRYFNKPLDMYITGTKRCPRARCNDFRKRKIRYHLLLMNGADARIEEHPKFLVKLKTLKSGGQILLDSSDNLYV